MKKLYLIFQQVGVLSKQLITNDGPFVLLVIFLLSSHISLAQNDRGIALHDVEGIIASLESKTPVSRQITGTYPPSYILDSISEGIHHVQGVARLTNGNYVFCHDSKDAATTGIMAFSRPGQDAVFRTFNNGDTLRHPSAMQASGNIVVVPSNEGGNSIHFFDGSSPNNPKELTHLAFTPIYKVGTLNRIMLANCAGLVYHEADQCHYVAVGSPNDEGIHGVSLYKSNGRDLVDPLCAFSHCSSFDGFVSQGGLSLLYDVSGKLYMAALYRSGSGVERVTLTELIMSGSSVSTIRQATRNLSSSTPSAVGPEPGFRWGGTIVPTSSNSVDVVGVSKFLYLNAAPGDYAEIKVWSGRSDIENCVTSKIKVPDENLFIGGDVGQLTAGANGHEWEFNKNSDGTYTVRLVGVVGNFYLRAPQNPYAAGGNKIQASQTNDDRSRWYIEPWIDGTVRMYPKHKYLSGLVGRPIRVGAGNSLILAENLDLVGLESQLFELSPTYPQITPVCKDLTVTLGSDNGLTLEPEDFVNFIVPETSCDVSYHVSKRNFFCADAGRTQTVTLTASAFETSATCTSEITVLEQLPTLNCPSSPIIRVADANTCSSTIVGQALEPSITYGCSYSLINDYNGSASLKGESFPVGTTTVTWTITNGDGVSATCPVDIEVIENEVPLVSCKPATVYLGADGQATINPEMVYDENSAADNCGTINLESVEPSVVSCSNIGEIEVTLTVDDGNGNIATCTTVVTVVDSLPPLNVQCDQLTASLDETGNVTVPSYLYNGQGTENCQIAGASISKFQFTCADIGVNQVIFSLIDASGNAGTCETTVTILGSSNLTPNVTDLPDAIGACAVDLVPPTATDDCDGSTIMASTSDPMTYSTQGTYVVNWMYDNGSGNTIAQTQRVIVEDQVGPVPDVANLPVAIGQCEVNVTIPTATDNCSGSVNASTTDPLIYTEQGTYVVNWDYMDGSGNSTSQTQTIIVADISPPTVACQAYDLQLDASGNGSIVVADIENGISDNCTSSENLSYSLSQTNFDCTHVGENWISLRVDDNNGNTSTCTALVIVFGVDADGDGFSLCEGDTDDDDPTVFPGAPSGSVEVRVWNDKDGDGVQDNHENGGIENVMVALQPQAGGSDITTTTGADGVAVFSDVPTGAYKIKVDPIPADHAITKSNKGGIESKDSDIGNDGLTRKISVVADQVVNNQDAGLWVPGTLTTRVWDDKDGDGIQDNNETGGIEGVEVYLVEKDSANTPILNPDTGNSQVKAITGSNGLATLNYVPADRAFRVLYLKPEYHAITLANKGGNDAKDSDIRNDGRSGVYRATKGGQSFTSVDAGMWAPGSIMARVWNDKDGDGRQDSDENGDNIANVEVQLTESDGTPIGRSTLTNANGVATFDAVPADRAVKLKFMLPADHAYTLRGKGSESKDSDAKNNGSTNAFQASKGSQPFINQDAGMWAPGTIEARVWNDLDGDGKQDGGESDENLAGASVQLLESNGDLIGSAVQTDTGGVATIMAVPADRPVKLKFELPSGYMFTLRDAGSNEAKDSDVRNNGETRNFSADRGSQVFNSMDAGAVAILSLAVSQIPLDNAIEQSIEHSDLTLYPVPTRDILTVEFSVEKPTDGLVIIFDQAGRWQLEQNSSLTEGYNTLKLDVNSLPSGFYYFQITTQNFSDTKKFMKR